MKIYKDHEGHLWVEAYSFGTEASKNSFAGEFAFETGLVCINQAELVKYVIGMKIEPQPLDDIDGTFGPLELITEVTP